MATTTSTTTPTNGNTGTGLAEATATETSSGNNQSGGGGSGGTGSEAGGGGGGAAIVQQYIPKQNNGQWMAIGSMIGTIAGMLYDSGTLDQAKDAESTWRTLTDLVKTRGVAEFQDHAEKLTSCNDALWDKLCSFATTGYCPDYQFILNSAIASSRAQMDSQLRSAKATSLRYNTGINSDVQSRLRAAQMMAVVVATVGANEQARQFTWTANWDMLQNAAKEVESARLGRIEMGGALIAGAGRNYANLAQSLRQTAAMDVGDLATLGSMLGVILPLLFQWGCSPSSGCD